MSEDSCYPEVLSHVLAPKPRGSNAFRWQNGRLRFILPQLGKPYSEWEFFVEPSSENWRCFWAECDRCGIWNASADFLASTECYAGSGLLVTTRLSYGGRVLRLCGALGTTNQVELETETDRLVDAFHFALQRLVSLSMPQHAASPGS